MVISLEAAQAVIDAFSELDRSGVLLDSKNAPHEIQVVTLDLATARLATQPMELGFPFKSVFVRSASDATASVSFRPHTTDDDQGAATLKQNDSLVFPRQLSKAFLHWDAQTGKTMTLIFFVTGEFRSGSQISQTGGGVSLVNGSSFVPSVVALGAAAATLVQASDSDRKKLTIQNTLANPIYIGNAATVTNAGATRGIEIQPGGDYEFNNTSACYAYNPGLAQNLQIVTEK